MSANFSFRKYSNPVFIETGTFKGEGVRRAISAGFKKIYSIELSEKLYRGASAKFNKEIKSGQVVLFNGDSTKLLPVILEKIEVRVTFWLDAHFCFGETARGDVDVPLLKELDSIARHPIRTHTILIDDVRLFGTKRDNSDWSEIMLSEVIAKIKQINSGYLIHYERGAVANDVLVAEIPYI